MGYLENIDRGYQEQANLAAYWAGKDAQKQHEAHKVMQDLVNLRNQHIANQQPSGGGGGGGGKSQEQIAREIAAEQARQEAERRRNNVFDEAKAMMSGWGIDINGSFTNQLRDWVWKDYSNDRILMEFRKSDTYNNRFTGMADLVKRGQFMNEAQYIELERAFKNTMTQWELPEGFYDSYDDFGRFIANGVSVAELDERIQSAKTILDEDADPEYAQALRDLGAGDGDLLAYVIDGDKAQNSIQKKLRAAAFTGSARVQNAFNQLGADSFGKYADALGAEYNDITGEELANLNRRVGMSGDIAERDSFLSSLEGDTEFQQADILDAEFLGDTNKLMASQKRGQREKARFQGVSGVGRNALGSRRSI